MSSAIVYPLSEINSIEIMQQEAGKICIMASEESDHSICNLKLYQQNEAASWPEKSKSD